jgi:hypothetical protein
LLGSFGGGCAMAELICIKLKIRIDGTAIILLIRFFLFILLSF